MAPGLADRPVVCAGRRMFHAGGSPARPLSKRGLKPKAGAQPLVGHGRVSKQKGKDRTTTIYGDAEMSAEQETLGMCARRLRIVGSFETDVFRDISQAGQGAHREVGSEGFAVNHRAVAEQGEPVGQNPGDNRAGTMAAKEILGAPGCIKVCAGGTVAQEHALPREVSYGLVPTGMGTWAYKPDGEVAGDAVREVGVTRGTQEPGNNTKSRDCLQRGAAGRRPKRRRSGGRGHIGRW